MIIKGSSILVTGGAGFIGAHVAKRLHELGARVVIVDNFNSYYSPQFKKDRVKALLSKLSIPIYRTDISNYKGMEKIFKKHNFDLICHQAAQAGVRYSISHPFLYEKANVLGTMTLLELAVLYRVKGFVFASSSSIYGERSKVPFREDDTSDTPASLYAATKKSCELLAHAYHALHGLHVTGLRYFTVYGPWARPDMAPMLFSRAIEEQKEIVMFNSGNMLRDFTYVDDIVEGVVRALQKNMPYGIFNIGAGKPISLRRFVTLLQKYMGKKARIAIGTHQKGDVTKTYADTLRARKVLKWTPKVNFEDGIEKFTKWYKSYYG